MTVATSTGQGESSPSRGAWRVVALVELLLAGVTGWLAFLCWPQGIATITTRLEDGTELVSSRYFGDWIAAAITLGTVSGLFVVDALRRAAWGLSARSAGGTAPRQAAGHQAVPGTLDR